MDYGDVIIHILKRKQGCIISLRSSVDAPRIPVGERLPPLIGKLQYLYLFSFLQGLGALHIYQSGNNNNSNTLIYTYETQDSPDTLFMCWHALTMLITFTIRDTKRFIDNWQYQRVKKEAKIQELYSNALECPPCP